MSANHAALKAILLALAALVTIGGVIGLLGARLIAALTPAYLGISFPAVTFAVMLISFIALALGYLLYLASRDPARYVGVIHAMIFLLIAAVFNDAYAAYGLHLYKGHAGWLIAREAVRLVLAAVLFALRPRGA